MPTFTNKIIIECPQDIANFWREHLPDLFDNNNITLRIPNNLYSVVTEGRGVKLIKGSTASVLDTDTVYLGFRCLVPIAREEARILFTELANHTAGQDSITGNPITIRDYHYRHNAIDYEKGYRERRGIFVGKIGAVKGSVSTGHINCNGQEIRSGSSYSSGFTFKFLEKTPEGYF